MATLSNTLSAITREKFIPVLVDNIFNSNVLNLKLMKNASKLDGGTVINVPIEVAANGNSGWIEANTAGDTDQDLYDIAARAQYNWKTAYNAIVISSDEQHMNMGSNQVLSMLKVKLSNAEKTLKDLFGTGIFNSSVVTDGLTTLNGANHGATSVEDDVLAHDNGNGLIHDFTGNTGTGLYIPQGGTDGAIVSYQRSLGGIDSDHNDGTNDYWNANLGSFEWAIGTVGGEIGAADLAINGSNDTGAMSFGDFVATSAGVASGVKAMTQMYGACSIDADVPDLIVTTQVMYDAYETALQANKRYEGDATLGDAGFQALRFKGASVVVDSHCPAGQMYFLNTKYLDYKVHSKRFFAYEDFKPLEAKDGIQARIFWMGDLTCSAPRMQGCLVGGPTGY